MPYSKPQSRAKVPINMVDLRRYALAYVGRYATTRGRLRSYLVRKTKERGWAEEDAPDFDSLIENFVELGYVDDAAFAASRSAALIRRGYGPVRVRGALQQSGIAPTLLAEHAQFDEDAQFSAAITFAKRRRLGPFARDGSANPDAKAFQRAMAAMMRAGHSFEVAQRVLKMTAKDKEQG